MIALIARGHQPIFPEMGGNTAATAVEITDVSLSQVAYWQATGPGDQLWLTFEGSEGQDVFLHPGKQAL